jgi:hypothetical protein
MNKIFKLSYYSEDYEIVHLFTHKMWMLTKEDFESDVKKLMRDHMIDYLKQEESFATAENLMCYIISVGGFEALGYEKVIPEPHYMIRECTFQKDDSEYDAPFIDIVGRELYDKAVQQNEDFGKGL